MASPGPEAALVKRTFPWIWMVVALVVGFGLGYTVRPMMMATKVTGTCVKGDTTTVFATSITLSDCQSKCGPDCWWQQN